MRERLVTRATVAVLLLVAATTFVEQGVASAGEDVGDDGPRFVEVDGSHEGHGQGGLDLPGLGGSGGGGGVDYPCYFYRPLADDYASGDSAVALTAAEDITVSMLIAGLIAWEDVSPSPRLAWPLAVGQPYFRDCYQPGEGPGTHTPAFTDEFCYRSPCGSSRTLDEVIENLRATVDPGPPLPVANPPLDSLVVGVESRFGVGQLLVEMTHRPDETGVLALEASITATPVRVDWAIGEDIFLTCGPDESMIGSDGMAGCAHTFSVATEGAVDGSVTVVWKVDATVTRSDGTVAAVPQPPVIERTDVLIHVREIEPLLR